MKITSLRIIAGLLMTALGAFAALGFGACANAAEDCNNTLTCPLPDHCYEAGDVSLSEIDGCH